MVVTMDSMPNVPDNYEAFTLVFKDLHDGAIYTAKHQANDFHSLNVPVCLVNQNVMTEISWTKSIVNKKKALTFQENNNPGYFQT